MQLSKIHSETTFRRPNNFFLVRFIRLRTLEKEWGRACLNYQQFLEKDMFIWKALKNLYSKKITTQSVVYITATLIRNRGYTHGNIYSQKKIIMY